MEAFFERLRHYAEIRPEARQGLEQADHIVRQIERHQRIMSEGEAVRHIFVMESGWAVRKRELEDGRHQILNFLLPGDIFDLQALIDSRADHTIEAIANCRVRQIGVSAFLEVIEREATAMSALWWSSVQEDGIMREHIIRVGRRSAIERIAHLCVELQRRLALCGEAQDDAPVNLPVTLRQIADALGLSPVHVSRTIGVLRRMGVLSNGKGIQLHDTQALSSIAGFEDNYLHLTAKPLERLRRVPLH